MTEGNETIHTNQNSQSEYKHLSGLGVSALVLGIIGIVFSFVPIINK